MVLVAALVLCTTDGRTRVLCATRCRKRADTDRHRRRTGVLELGKMNGPGGEDEGTMKGPNGETIFFSMQVC